jgi:transcriptional regulator with XRE-family HTH domain
MGREAIVQGEVGFGLLLRAHRGANGLTQEELAARAGLSTEAVSALERGSRRAPRAATVECLAGALKLDPARRAEFAAAARGWSEPIGSANGPGDIAVYKRASGTEQRNASLQRNAPTYLGKRWALVGLVVLLLAVLAFVAYPALSHIVGGRGPTASAAKPVITDLSITPSTLSPSPSSHIVIRFHINVDSNVTVTVTDSEGRIIKKLLENDPRQAGPVSKPYYGYDGATTVSPGRYLVVVSARANGSAATAHALLIIT